LKKDERTKDDNDVLSKMQEAYGAFCFALQGWETAITFVGSKTYGTETARLRRTEIPGTEKNGKDNKEDDCQARVQDMQPHRVQISN
jgi:hypothetical protein